MTCATFSLEGGVMRNTPNDNGKAPARIKERIGKVVKVTAPDGSHWQGKVVSYHEGPVIVIEAGWNQKAVPADYEVEDLLPPRYVTCSHCNGKGQWNEGGPDPNGAFFGLSPFLIGT